MYSGFHSDGFSGMSINSQSSSVQNMHTMMSPGDTDGIFMGMGEDGPLRSRIFMVSLPVVVVVVVVLTIVVLNHTSISTGRTQTKW